MMSQFGSTLFFIITGNYGSVKTEIALNLAFDSAKKGKTTLVDLDIVNPYFRSGEKERELRNAGVRVLMPTFALTTVDIPALPAEIQSVFEDGSDFVVFDVGGDDTGAAALGRFYPSFMAHRAETKVLFVVNCMRPLTRETDEITDLAERIISRGRLKIDALVNNTNFGNRTEPAMVEAGEKTVLSCAERLGVQEVITAGEKEILESSSLVTPTLTICRHMIPEWME